MLHIVNALAADSNLAKTLRNTAVQERRRRRVLITPFSGQGAVKALRRSVPCSPLSVWRRDRGSKLMSSGLETVSEERSQGSFGWGEREREELLGLGEK